jgi:acetylglutamate kinase
MIRTEPKTAATPTIVIKVGGSQLKETNGQGDNPIDRLGLHIRNLHQQGSAVVVVHGGGPEVGKLHNDLGMPYRLLRGLRLTPEESMPLVTMALCGLVNKRLVARLVALGLPAVGLSGVDLKLLRSNFLNRQALGRVGGPPQVDRSILGEFLENQRIPVLAPVCCGPDGEPINVNADTVAHAVAIAMCATSLDFVSDIPGVKTPDEVAAKRLSRTDISGLLTSSAVSEGMIPKLQAAAAAIDAGVGRVRVGNIDGILEDTATEIVG